MDPLLTLLSRASWGPRLEYCWAFALPTPSGPMLSQGTGGVVDEGEGAWLDVVDVDDVLVEEVETVEPVVEVVLREDVVEADVVVVVIVEVVGLTSVREPFS